MTSPPGWYPDPLRSGGQRYWDGHQWGVARSAAHPGRAIGILAAIILAGTGACVAIGILGSGDDQAMDEDGTFYHINESTAGTYETDGSQRASGRPCNWTRTRRPTLKINDGIAAGTVAVGERGQVTVNAGEYFVSFGCKPWRKQ